MLVIHGSALTSASPRDIDVVHTGRWTPAMEQAVRDWAATRDLPATLPLDVHHAIPEEGRLTIPAPCAEELAAFEVIDGDPNFVRVQILTDFTSGIRAFGDNPDDFLRRLAASEFSNKISLLPSEAHLDYGARFGIPWDKYCAGLVAFRSAVRHAPAWPGICARLGGGGELLARLVDGEEPTRNWRAAPNTPGGVTGHNDGWSQAVSLRVSSSGSWSVGGRAFGSADAAAEWLGLA